MLPAERLDDLAHDVLDAVVDYYTAQGELLPARRYVSPSRPPTDCEQLTVHVDRVVGQQGDVVAEQYNAVRPHPGHTLRAAEVIVTIMRCAPVIAKVGGKAVLPSELAEEAAALQVYKDVVLVLNALITAEKAGDLSGCHSLAFMDWATITAEGGFVGGQQRLRIGLQVGA